MKRIILLACLFSCTSVMAHSGRTDSSGGHNCSSASQQKGLCSGYHYHKSIDYSEPMASKHEHKEEQAVKPTKLEKVS